MKVKDAMTYEVHLASPNQTIREVAQAMAELDVGALPVGDKDRLVGMITDRDIAVRAVASGRGPATKVREVMSNTVKYCFEDEDISHISENIADIQLHRLPVMSREKRLVGIVALGDTANAGGAQPAGRALCGISAPN